MAPAVVTNLTLVLAQDVQPMQVSKHLGFLHTAQRLGLMQPQEPRQQSPVSGKRARAVTGDADRPCSSRQQKPPQSMAAAKVKPAASKALKGRTAAAKAKAAAAQARRRKANLPVPATAAPAQASVAKPKAANGAEHKAAAAAENFPKVTTAGRPADVAEFADQLLAELARNASSQPEPRTAAEVIGQLWSYQDWMLALPCEADDSLDSYFVAHRLWKRLVALQRHLGKDEQDELWTMMGLSQLKMFSGEHSHYLDKLPGTWNARHVEMFFGVRPDLLGMWSGLWGAALTVGKASSRLANKSGDTLLATLHRTLHTYRQKHGVVPCPAELLQAAVL
jgi:hypothetical protein